MQKESLLDSLTPLFKTPEVTTQREVMRRRNNRADPSFGTTELSLASTVFLRFVGVCGRVPSHLSLNIVSHSLALGPRE